MWWNFIIVVVYMVNTVKLTHINVALLVSKERDIDNIALENSVAWAHKHVLKGYGVVINILKVIVEQNKYIGESNILNNNLTKSSFILEPYYTNEHSCILSDLLNVPLISIADTHIKSCKNTIYMRPYPDKLIEVISNLLIEEGILNIGIVIEQEASQLATEIISSSSNSLKIYFMFLKSVDMDQYDDVEKTFTRIKSQNHRHILLVMRSYNNIKFIKMFQNANPAYDVKWFVPLITVTSDDDLSLLSKMSGLIIPINYEQLHNVKSQIDQMKTEHEKTFPGYRNINPLIHDAIILIAETIKLIPNDLKRLKTQNKCVLDNLTVKTHLSESIKRIYFHGLTGRITFTKFGYRNVTNLDIGEVNENGEFQIVGKWVSECQIIRWDYQLTKRTREKSKQCSSKLNVAISKRVRKKHLRIVTIPESPLINFNSSLGEGNERFTGFCKDLLERLSKELKFSYELYIDPGDTQSYGTCETEDENKACNWNGLIGEIVKKHADGAIGSITITSERESIVDFSKPFMDFTMTLLMEKSSEKEFDIFAFLRPFEPTVWVSIVAVIIIVTLVLYYIDKSSPNGCCHLAKIEKCDLKGDEFSFPNCIWFTTASLLQQGPDYTPKSPASRILSATFWFFTLIIISTYTANLAAFFTTSQNVMGIKSLEDLAKQDKLEYGILGRGQTYSLFKNSHIPLYKQMYNFMRLKNGFAQSSVEGVERVRQGGYAYLSEDPIVYYKHQRQPCNTAVLRNLLEAKSYGIVLQKQSEWTNPISVMILDLREKGYIEQLRRKWWDEASECNINEKGATGKPISLKITTLGGIYIIMAVGVITALIFLIVEIRYKNLLGGRCLPREYTFDKSISSINHEIRFVDTSEPEELIVKRIQQQMNTSKENLHNKVHNLYSPKESPPLQYMFKPTKRDYRDIQESTL